MNTPSNIFVKTIALSALIAVTKTMSMDGYPQLQLQQAEKTSIKSVNATLKLASLVYYSPSAYSKNPPLQILFKGRPHRYLNDPLIFVSLSFENDVIPTKTVSIPAKQLFNLNDGSIIKFHILDPSNPKNNLFINATCQAHRECPCQNPVCQNFQETFSGNNFDQQFKSIMLVFYKTPYVEINFARYQTLLKEKIITHDMSLLPDIAAFPDTIPLIRCLHGKQGCSDEKTFMQLIIKPKIKSYGNSVYQLINQRQIGTRPHFTTKVTLDSILDNCLRIMEFETIAENNLLDECFCELQVNCLLTRLFINHKIAQLFIKESAQ